MTDKEKKETFINIWEEKVKKSPYQLEWAGGFFSNRQTPIWSVIEVREEGKKETFRLTVLEKPSYIDNFGKARFMWYIICKDRADRIIVTNTNCIRNFISKPSENGK
jgi:hypothetical protein